ncbi:MAG: 3-phosphoshikimate 1-carboxyvinyltransferase [Paludibacter sp.]|nr:MAG: 3-phosphoshikimate 1-carboxyvinyltransferase [Paludibacter sp.]
MKSSLKILPNNRLIDENINLPTSKSISNRVLIINELAGSQLKINNLSQSDDTQVLANILRSDNSFFDIGAAGTTMRFLTAFLAQRSGEWQLTGSERMKQRPIKILVNAINSLGGDIQYLEKKGFPPLKITGKRLNGGEIELDGGVSSQYISALMMIAPTMKNGLKMKLKGEIISVPYILMTKAIMEEYGINVTFENNTISILPQNYEPISYTVEADWSGASYWYEILALDKNGTIELNNLYSNSLQGDKKIADIFTNFGIETIFTKKSVKLHYNKDLVFKDKIFKYDFTDTPDLAQTVVVTSCLLSIPFEFTGLQSLRIKETDRINALSTELKKLGFLLQEKDHDKLLWSGERCNAENQPIIQTYEDHRMAMSFAPIGLIQPIEIENPEVVSKSYPNFWQDFKKIFL